MSAALKLTTESVRARLGDELPQSFLQTHSHFMSAMTLLASSGKPVRILEHGAGDLAGDARYFSAVCGAVAEATGGECVAVVTSDDAQFRAALATDAGRRKTRVIRESPTALRELSGPFDVIVSHATDRDQHPLQTLWTFTALRRQLRPDGYWVFSQPPTNQEPRTAYVQSFLMWAGIAPTAYGSDCVWQMRPERHPEPMRRLSGTFSPLVSSIAGQDFLRLYDQLFAPVLGHRTQTFRKIFESLLRRPGPYTIIETGTTRPGGDMTSNGQSTVLFDLFVNLCGGKVVTIDLSETNISYCQGRVSSKTMLVPSDSIAALRQINEVEEADLIYLDSYDVDPVNPHPSSIHHMYELSAVWGRTKPDALVVIDDCFGPDSGKHVYVMRYLRWLGIEPAFVGWQTGWII